MKWQNTTTEERKHGIRNGLTSKKLEDKIGYKRNTTLAKREVRRRHRASWDRSVTNLEHETYRRKGLQNFKTNKQGYTAKIQGNVGENIFLQFYKKIVRHNKH